MVRQCGQCGGMCTALLVFCGNKQQQQQLLHYQLTATVVLMYIYNYCYQRPRKTFILIRFITIPTYTRCSINVYDDKTYFKKEHV